MYKLNKLSTIIVTGRTWSFGRAFVSYILDLYPDISRLVVFSRDEYKQYEMQQDFPTSKYPGLRYFLGDVRDKNRLKKALDGIEVVVHAAALKQVDAAENNPFECIKTNILGTQNLVEASLEANVYKLVCISTDKAASPSNLYGATKLCSERLILSAINYKGNKPLTACIVRYGNVLGSRGSVVPAFLKQLKTGTIKITSPEMTRFNIRLEDGVNLVKWCIENMKSNEIFVPKLKSYNILDLAEVLAPNAKREFIGKRKGEKLHEVMITSEESLFTIDKGEFYIIL